MRDKLLFIQGVSQMPASSDKQQLQVHNIVNTLLEATEHFHNLIRDKQLNQSIFIFSSIVEGFDAVSNMITKLDDKEWIKQKESMDKYLLMIAQQLEQGRFLKISEILQFSFLPLLKRTEKFIADSIGSKNQNKAYSIGVFASFRNPREFYTEPRVNALVQESERQNVQLLFFTSNDVDFDKKEIKADVCNNEKWERISTPFPDVINNVSAGKRSHIERKLRRQIPFTSFHVGNKYYLPKKIVQNRKYAELLVPFRVCLNDQDIHQFLEKNHKVVLKALLSNRGENIFFVTKKGNHYSLYENKKERILNQEAFNIWLHTIILKKKEVIFTHELIMTNLIIFVHRFKKMARENG